MKLHFLESRSQGGYVTFGVPWKKGQTQLDTDFSIIDENGKKLPVQSSAKAYWQDGSVKWTSHTAFISTATAELVKEKTYFEDYNEIEENDETIIVKNGLFDVSFFKKGSILMETPFGATRLKSIKEQRKFEDGVEYKKSIPYYGEIENIEIEENGKLKTVVKITGSHQRNGESFLRFVIRFMVYYKSNEIKILHTFLYDADMNTDFIKGVGIETTRHMHGELYNRRIKFTGDCGIFHETLQLLNVWRPKIGTEYYKAQLNGQLLDLDKDDEKIKAAIDDIATWDTYKMTQITSDSFTVKKRTQSPNCSFVDANFGRRSKGLMYVADEACGTAVAIRDFWQKFPSGLEASGLSKEDSIITAWIITPDCEAFDMRHYDTKAHSQAYYEGFDIIDCDPYGIANTNEISMFVFDQIASDSKLMELADSVQKPPVMLCDVEYYHDVKALGEWSLISRDTPLKVWLEDEMDKAFDFYKNEIEQRRWYGLFNYGDVMHTYDAFRHCWKYDMGGYAWQNTELVPTLWLWYAFMRSGREDIFTVAEAMTRHASEVDIYHFGKLKGLGSRHNVVHWGDSCKEPRVAMAGHHRGLYYLTGGDYRLGDVFDDVKDADFSTIYMDPLRFFYDKSEMKLPTHARSGPDWTTYCSNWFTEWERTGNEYYKNKILTGLKDMSKSPMRMISGSNYEYDPETGHLGYIGESAAGGSHLAVCMGGPQTYAELEPCLDYPEFKDMLIQYGEFYYLPIEEKKQISNGLLTGNGFVYPYMAAGLAGYAARENKNKKLAYQVWQVLIHSLAGKDKKDAFDKNIVKNYFNTESLDEMFWISTNFTAQWCLETIAALEFTKDYLPYSKDEVEWEDWVK